MNNKVILPYDLIGYINSFLPRAIHPNAKIIKDMIPIYITDVYETNILANEMRLNCNYNFYEWYYKLHYFYIKYKRFEIMDGYSDFDTKINERFLKIKYLIHKKEVMRKIDWRLYPHHKKTW
jgi:hypothetical protein